MFNVSRRLIVFIVFPERLERNYQCRLDNGGSKIYYNREKHNEAIKKYRRYKYENLKQTIIKS